MMCSLYESFLIAYAVHESIFRGIFCSRLMHSLHCVSRYVMALGLLAGERCRRIWNLSHVVACDSWNDEQTVTNRVEKSFTSTCFAWARQDPEKLAWSH